MSGKVDMYLYAYNKSNYGYLFIGGVAGQNSYTIQNTICDIRYSFSAISAGVNTEKYAGTVSPHASLRIGGAIGDNYGTITACKITVDGLVDAKATNGHRTNAINDVLFGGFASLNHGTVSSCVSEGALTIGSEFYYLDAAGFSTHNFKTIRDCYTAVDITINSTGRTDNWVGGFVSINKQGGSITSCYTTSNIVSSSQSNYGGFVGLQDSGATISKSFCAGDLTIQNTPASAGHFIGKASDGSTLFKVYYNSAMQLQVNGNPYSAATEGGTGTTDAELQSKALLAESLSWSDDIWSFSEAAYPTLVWETQTSTED